MLGDGIAVSSEVADELLAGGFSGIVRVVHRGKPLVQYGAGRTRAGSGRAIGNDTRFAAASVSKMFTAACIAQLAEHGLCRLEEPVADYVPKAHTFGEGVTLDALLSHRAGLGDYIDDDAALPFAA